MLVTVKLSPDVAEALRQPAAEWEEPASKASSLVSTIRDFGARLVPTHPQTQDPELKTYFQVEVSDKRTADQVVAALHRTSIVEAAYCKPAEELP